MVARKQSSFSSILFLVYVALWVIWRQVIYLTFMLKYIIDIRIAHVSPMELLNTV